MPNPTPHKPTDITRSEVKALASFGNTQEQISSYIDIDIKTLQKYYRRELDTASIQANAQVAKRLYNKAVMQDDLTAQIFWLKTRARWRADDAIQMSDNHDKLLQELKELREKLEAQNKKDY